MEEMQNKMSNRSSLINKHIHHQNRRPISQVIVHYFIDEMMEKLLRRIYNSTNANKIYFEITIT